MKEDTFHNYVLFFLYIFIIVFIELISNKIKIINDGFIIVSSVIIFNGIGLLKIVYI